LRFDAQRLRGFNFSFFSSCAILPHFHQFSFTQSSQTYAASEMMFTATKNSFVAIFAALPERRQRRLYGRTE